MRFHFTENPEKYEAKLHIDEEGFIFTIKTDSFKGQHEKIVEDFSTTLGRSLGVRDPSYLVMVGRVEIVMEAEDRLVSMDWRLGPAVLKPGRVAAPQGRARGLRIEAEWDANERAEAPGQDFSVFDRTSWALMMTLGSEATDWGYLTEGFAVGLSDAGALSAVYVERCPLDLWALVNRAAK